MPPLPLTGLTDVRELAALALELDESSRQAWLEAEPRLIGPYRLLRALGSGGMGTVWLAERADGAYRRQVALKLPRHELAPGLLARWNRERDILASLEHPNIARLYDAGADASGQPYLVLEYVDGQPIDQEAEHLDLRTRLALFLKVTEAVSHAHRLGILHRDIKPGNILVDSQGRVRLLDFGVAKILEGDNADPVTQLTELDGIALSPDYASPEQVCGESLTVTSDVYSLGAVLHALLVGVPPHRFQGRHTQAVATALRGEDAVPVSHRATTPTLRRLLAGDLDAIVARALRNRPADRYPTAEALGADISRYLDGLPVLARRHGRFYAIRRFVRRHRGAIAVSLVLTLGSAVLGTRLGAFNQTGTTAPPADAAVLARIVVLPFANQTGAPAEDYLAESFTTSLTADLARIRDVQVIDVETARSMRTLADQPARLSAALGVRYVLTGSIRGSTGHLQVRAELRDTRTGSTLWSQDYEGEQSRLFDLQDRMTSRVGNTIGHQLVREAADASQLRQDPDLRDLILRARAEDQKSVTTGSAQRREALWRQVLARNPDNVDAMASLAVVLIQNWRDDPDDATARQPNPKVDEGYALAQKALALDPENPTVYYALTIYHTAHRRYDLAVKAAEKRLALEPGSPSAHNLLGNLLSASDPERAIEVLREGVARDPDPAHPFDKLRTNLANCYLLTGRFLQSVAELEEVRAREPLQAEQEATLAMAYAMSGQAEKAAEARAHVRRLRPDFTFSAYIEDPPSAFSARVRTLQHTVLAPAWQRAGLPD